MGNPKRCSSYTHGELPRFHFEALAHDNNATDQTVEEVIYPELDQHDEIPNAQPPCIALVGSQVVPKFNKSAQEADLVKLYMAVWRVDAKGTDIVLSVNVPVVTGADGNAKGVGELGVAFARVVWEKARSTFKIDDFGLFA